MQYGINISMLVSINMLFLKEISTISGLTKFEYKQLYQPKHRNHNITLKLIVITNNKLMLVIIKTKRKAKTK